LDVMLCRWVSVSRPSEGT